MVQFDPSLRLLKSDEVLDSDEQGRRYLSPEEQALAAQNRSQQLEEILRSLGVDPDIV